MDVGLLSDYLEMKARYGHQLLPVNEFTSQPESISPLMTTETSLDYF